MSGTHFYLTLPSNTSLDVFPNNKTGNYHVKLPQTIYLHGDRELGLYSISYSNTSYTLQNRENLVYCSKDAARNFWSSANVDYGYYATVPDLIKAINTAMHKEFGNTKITFSFNPRTEKIKITLAPLHYVKLCGKLSAMLGYGGADIKIRKSGESPYVADLFGITSIYVYCDIVQPQILGNTSVPLLRTIPVSEKSGEIITKTFTNIQYVPLPKKSFEDIEILLRRDTGDAVPFERGKVMATLYFRKQSYFS